MQSGALGAAPEARIARGGRGSPACGREGREAGREVGGEKEGGRERVVQQGGSGGLAGSQQLGRDAH
jgi:hypothetical protein